MHILDLIGILHTRRFVERPLIRLHNSPDDVANPIYEIEDFLRDRLVLDPPQHDDVYCDNPECSYALSTNEVISGLLYYCLDCGPDRVDFCSKCVVLPGQGIGHDPKHRLLQLLPTKCEICQGVSLNTEYPKTGFNGPYTEYSALCADLKRVAETSACGFCSFVWNALMQHRLDGIQWPPNEDKMVTIIIERPRSKWLALEALTDGEGLEETEGEVGGIPLVFRAQRHHLKNQMEVGMTVVWSHEMFVSPGPSEAGIPEPNTFARVQNSSGSDDALTLAKMWLASCRETHSSCREVDSNVPPTRLIDLQGKDPARVYLREFCADADEYAALTYCWGDGDRGLVTERSNIVSHRNDGIEIGTLPKTIRDTIHATRKLGLRYLWVDRLCIVQDSQDDWAREAALMCAVYSGATITLSADGSDSASKGLFQTDQALSKLKYTEYVDPDGDANLILLVQRPPHSCLNSIQTLDTRGWTMQERLMSRRILHFTSDEMVWECNTLTECECRRRSGASSRELSAQGLQDMESIYEKWRLIVDSYTNRSLRYDKDKLPALRGLAEKFQRLMASISDSGSEPPDEYLAGLWRGDLVAQLAWKPRPAFSTSRYTGTTDAVQTAGNDVCHEADEYVAPSWTWAHLKGRIHYVTFEPRTPFVSCADIIEARMVPVEPTGLVSSGFITLKGHMVRGLSADIREVTYENDERRSRFLHILLHKKTNGYICCFPFEPDDGAGLKRRHGSSISDVMLFLLGTQDPRPTRGVYGVGGSRMERISTPIPVGKRKVTSEEDMLEVGFENLHIDNSIPEELFKSFFDNSEHRQYSFYLVLVESQDQKGKYERIGCFDVWKENEVDVMETLFQDSEKGEITII